MSVPTRARVQVSHTFSASAERVYDAWLDPTRVGQWLFATPTGRVVRVEIDARVGGSFVITDRRDGVDVEHTGEYVELDRPRRIVFLFGVPAYSPNKDRVSVDIVRKGRGCEVTITHELGPVDADTGDKARSGWSGILAGLEHTLGKA
jgi:uncharacterized protein YndB with AHSA1/START domain